MNFIEFNNILKMCFEKSGFKSKNRNYFYENESILVVVNIQKSNFDDSYYINYGFVLRNIHDNISKFKINDCDIIGRFVNNINDATEYDFKVSDIISDKLIECINDNIINILLPVINGGIKKYFEMYPQAIFAAKKCLKDYLNI